MSMTILNNFLEFVGKNTIMVDIIISSIGAIVSIAIAFFGSRNALKQALYMLKVDKEIDAYEKMLHLFSKLKSDPQLLFQIEFINDLSSLKPFSDVYSSSAVQEMYTEFCQKTEKIFINYQNEFHDEDLEEEKASCIASVPWAKELFEKEEDDYMINTLIEKSMLPDDINQYIDKICAAIREEFARKKYKKSI